MKTTLRKAGGAAAGALATGIGTALLDGALTTGEVSVAIGGALLAAATVWKLAYQVPAE